MAYETICSKCEATLTGPIAPTAAPGSMAVTHHMAQRFLTAGVPENGFALLSDNSVYRKASVFSSMGKVFIPKLKKIQWI